MKKKIAVIFSRMIVGGAEKACLNFLKEIDKSKYEVYLFTRTENNPYIRDISTNVIVCNIAEVDTRKILIDDLRNLRIASAIRGMFNRLMCRFARGEYDRLIYAQKTYVLSDICFDCAIAYKANHPDTATTLYSIKAKKKVAIVHSSLQDQRNVVQKFAPHFTKFDHVFCVSDAQCQRTKGIYPQMASKSSVMHNVMDVQEIRRQSEEFTVDYHRNALVTVGRLSSEKGQQMVPKTVRILLDQGYHVHWYLVGDGPLREEVEQECEKYGVQDRVILLGTRMNPYPYIKACDIYVQPSFTEGYCTTTVEAKILGKPIVTTDAPGMREQFVSGENGLIVDAMTPEALAEGIRTLLDHPEKMEKFRNALRENQIDNSAELQKLYDIIES